MTQIKLRSEPIVSDQIKTGDRNTGNSLETNKHSQRVRLIAQPLRVKDESSAHMWAGIGSSLINRKHTQSKIK